VARGNALGERPRRGGAARAGAVRGAREQAGRAARRAGWRATAERERAARRPTAPSGVRRAGAEAQELGGPGLEQASAGAGVRAARGGVRGSGEWLGHRRTSGNGGRRTGVGRRRAGSAQAVAQRWWRAALRADAESAGGVEQGAQAARACEHRSTWALVAGTGTSCAA
jgi:hypothetical protein